MNDCKKKCFEIVDETYNLCIESTQLDFIAEMGYVGGGSYAPLSDKPQINFRTLQAGNNTYEELGIEPSINDITEQDIDNIIYGG